MHLTSVRLRIASGAGVLAIGGIVGQALLEPKGAEQSTAAALNAAAAHQGAWFVADWAEILGFSSAAFVLVTVVGLVRGRGVWLTAVGGWLSTVALLVIGLNALSLAQGVFARQPDRSAMVHAVDDLQSSAAVVPLLALAALSLVGPVLLAFGVQRAGLVGWWLPSVAVLGVALYAVLGGGDDGGLPAVLVQVPLAVQIGTYCVLMARRASSAPAPAPRAGATTPAPPAQLAGQMS